MTVQIIYIFILIILMLLDSLHKKGWLSLKELSGIMFFVLLLFCAIRYDTDVDYAEYVRWFNKIRLGKEVENSEPAFIWLNRLFSFYQDGYIYVFAICSFFCLYALKKTFLRFDIIKWGWFLAITLSLIAVSNNQVRQALSVSIFILAIPYVEKRKFWKFSLLIAIAFVFHFTAIFAIGYYFLFQYLKRVNFGPDVWLFLVLSVFSLYYFGFFHAVGLSAFELIPRYAHYVDHQAYIEGRKLSSGFGIFGLLLSAIILILVKRKFNKEDLIYADMGIAFFVITFLFNDIGVLTRVASYLSIFVVIAYSKLLINPKVQIYYKIVLLLLVVATWGRKAYLRDKPYSTVFSQQKKEGKFYKRDRETNLSARYLTDYFYYNYDKDWYYYK